MAVSSSPVYPQSCIANIAAITNATGTYQFNSSSPTATTGLVALVVGGTNGSIVDAITVTNTDGITSSSGGTDYYVQLVLINSTTGGVLYTGIVNYGAGYQRVATTAYIDNPPLNVMTDPNGPGLSYDVNGNRILYVPNGTTLYGAAFYYTGASSVTSVTAVKVNQQITFIATGGNL